MTTGPTATSPGTADPATAALASMLLVEHAAVYAAAAAGGALAPLGDAAAGAREFARTSYEAHRARRDELTAVITAAGGQAPAAASAYQLPLAPSDPTSALALLADVEDRCAAATHDAIAMLAGPVRAAAAASLAQAAVRAQRMRLAAGLPPDTATRALPGG